MSGWSGQKNPRITVTFFRLILGQENPSIIFFYWVSLRPEKPEIHAKFIMSGWSGQKNPRITVTFLHLILDQENPRIMVTFLCLIPGQKNPGIMFLWDDWGPRKSKVRIPSERRIRPRKNPQGVENRARKTRGPYSPVESAVVIWSIRLNRVPEISPVEWLFRLFPQWKLVGESASLVEGKNQVRRLFFCVYCVSFRCMLIFWKIWIHECGFLKNQGGKL